LRLRGFALNLSDFAPISFHSLAPQGTFLTSGRLNLGAEQGESVNSNDLSLEPTADAELIRATLGGDRGAFGALVERYQDRLFNMLVQVLGSRDDAADVLQEAFVQAYQKLETYRGTAQFYTWLYRLTMNRALSHRRKESRNRHAVSIDEAKMTTGDQPLDHQPSPERVLVASERCEQVQAALLRISDEHRQILVLREMEDCSYEVIAEMLELPVGTVRSRLFRARLQLKAELEGVLGDERFSHRVT